MGFAMTASVSYADVFEISTGDGLGDEIQAGDIVRTGRNHFPHFVVVAVNGDKVWIRNLQSGHDAIAAASKCRRINDPS
jgi:hypothetical protein